VLFQDTSLVYVSALADFFGAAYKVGDRDGRLVELLLFAGRSISSVLQPVPGGAPLQKRMAAFWDST
jgi:hypothetical protein